MTIEAEQAVLGGMMLIGPESEQAEMILDMLKPSSFTDGDNQLIFQAIKNLASRGSYPDVLTLGEECRKDKRFRDDIDSYLVELVSNTPTAANIVSYAGIVRDRAVERFAVQKMNEALATITDQYAGNIYQRLGIAESLITAIQERGMGGKSKGLTHIRDIGKAWLPEVLERVENGVYGGYTLGLDALDGMLYPKRVPPGSLVVVGARPKMGKTGFMAMIAEHFACKIKNAVAMFSLEMPDNQIYERLVTGSAKVDPELFYRPARDADDWSKVTAAAQRFNDSSFYIDDTPNINLSHVLREARSLNRKNKVGLVAVDYLTLMDAEKAERNDLAYGNITKRLKGLAKELDCVVLLLTQLNRNLEDRKDKRPMPSDSRDTGQIEQDCDLWIGLYREHAYDQSFSSQTLTEAIVRLNRHGKTGTVYFDLVNGAAQETDQTRAAVLSDRPSKVTRLSV